MGEDTSYLHPGATKVRVYEIGRTDSHYKVWWSDEPFPGWATLVPPEFPTVKPTGSPVTMLKPVLQNKTNLLLIAGLIAVVFFSKPLLKIAKKPLAGVKKIGRKVGIK